MYEPHANLFGKLVSFHLINFPYKQAVFNPSGKLNCSCLINKCLRLAFTCRTTCRHLSSQNYICLGSLSGEGCVGRVLGALKNECFILIHTGFYYYTFHALANKKTDLM